MNHDLITRAADFAAVKHAARRRKYTFEPYVNHLRNVAQLLADHGQSPEVVAAGWLHDTIEDTDTTFADLSEAFGSRVATLVLEVTDVSSPVDGNRVARKAKDRQHLARSSVAGATIKLADLIDNSRDIVKHDPAFARIYLAEKEALLGVLSHGNGDLYALALKVLAEAQALLHESAA